MNFIPKIIFTTQSWVNVIDLVCTLYLGGKKIQMFIDNTELTVIAVKLKLSAWNSVATHETGWTLKGRHNSVLIDLR